MNTQRQSGRVAIKIDNIENKTNNFNQSEDSKNTKFIYKFIIININLPATCKSFLGYKIHFYYNVIQ